MHEAKDASACEEGKRHLNTNVEFALTGPTVLSATPRRLRIVIGRLSSS